MRLFLPATIVVTCSGDSMKDRCFHLLPWLASEEGDAIVVPTMDSIEYYLQIDKLCRVKCNTFAIDATHSEEKLFLMGVFVNLAAQETKKRGKSKKRKITRKQLRSI